MYLSSAFLKELLEVNGYTGMDSIYVSCEHQCSKGNGGLFRHARSKLPEDTRLIHVGDNKRNDVRMAENCGFDSLYYPNVNRRAPDFRAYDMSPVIGGAYRGIVDNHLYAGIVLFKGSWDETWEFMRMIYHGTALKRRKVYLRPFENTMMFLELWEYPYARWNVLGNILLFVPFGGLLRGFLNGWKGAACAFTFSFLTSLGFELIQLLYGIGEFDVDDIMLNVLGSLLGYLAVCVVYGVIRTIPRVMNGTEQAE